MEENQIFEKLHSNLYDLDNVNSEISMVELAIYQKSIEELQKTKLNEIREFFEQKAKFYNQKIEKYNYGINRNIEKYKNQMNKLANAYNNLYVNVFKIMENAINNQKISVANIVTLTERLKKEDIKVEEIEQIKNNILACAEKKLNYAVIIEECKARIKWCTKDVLNSINEIFQNNIYQLQIYDESIVNKIKRNFFNIIFGKSCYKRFVENYEFEYLKHIKQKNNTKILDIISTIKGIIKQMEETQKQISMKYEEKMCVAPN